MRVTWLIPFAIACAPHAPPIHPTTAPIEAVLAAFERALPAHDGAALDKLWLAPEIPFRMRIVATNQIVDAGTGARFAHDVATATTSWEERFHDVTIVPTSDGLAMLDASYEFVEDGKVTNHGRELWVLVDTPAGWKIASVTWSVIVDAR